MSGFITKVEVEANRDYIIDTWGESFYNLCMSVEDNTTTFLSLLVSEGKI